MQDPEIKFSHFYNKMPKNALTGFTTIMHIFVDNKQNLSPDFIIYDTLYYDHQEKIRYYQLPEGKIIVIILKTDNELWTTIRRWDKRKEQYYRSLVGKQVKIIVNDG